MRSIVFALVLALLPVPAFAAAPPEIAPYIKASAPYGTARLTKLVFKVYDATLWTDAVSFSMKKPFALRLQYLMNFDGDDLAQRSIDEMDGQEQLDKTTAAVWQAQLEKLFPDVKKGDHITAIYLPAKGTRLYYNGKFRGSISDPVFSERFIDIWMSPKTSEREVRRRLLAKE